jgi:hypothetical protein
VDPHLFQYPSRAFKLNADPDPGFPTNADHCSGSWLDFADTGKLNFFMKNIRKVGWKGGVYLSEQNFNKLKFRMEFLNFVSFQNIISEI